MIEVVLDDRLGKRVRIKCLPTDTVGDLKRLAAAKLGTRPERIVLKRQQYAVLKDHIPLEDYEVADGSSLELFYI